MAETASAQIAANSTGPTTYQYTITLNDNGTTPIGTFWFAWNASPDENFLPVQPTQIGSPQGWQAIVTHGSAADGYGIQWAATSAASDLTPGASISTFTFSSTVPPITMLSKSQVDPTFATTASFIYSGTPFSDAGFNFSVAGLVSPQAVTNAYTGILRTFPTTSVLGQTVNAIETGQMTLAQFDSELISSEQTLYTTLPALVTIDAFYSATPQSATLNTVAAAVGTPAQIGGFYAAQYLHNLGYSDQNVWTIMASQWGADHTSAFYQQYNSFGTNYSGFISAVYQREFGIAPSAANLQTLVNDVPGVQALLGGGGGAATPIQVVSGIYGYLLYTGQTTPSIKTQYGTAANAFLQAAANGTANYGQELTQQFPASTATVMSSAMVDPGVISITSSDQLIDPGAGNFAIQFQAGSGGDTLVLHKAGVDQVSGFDPASDVLDLRALVAGTGLALSGDVAALSGYVTIADQGNDALVRFDPIGQGGGATVAVLRGLGASVTGLDTLTANGAIRIS